MFGKSKKPASGQGQRTSEPLSGGKHYVCGLCQEKYELTEDQQGKVTCCGYPVNKTEETVMSSPEPFGP